MVAKITVSEGEFTGWQTYDLHGTFDQVVGPFYFKPDPDGRMRCAFRAEPKHMNAGHRMHGGCLMTFAMIGGRVKSTEPRLCMPIKTSNSRIVMRKSVFIKSLAFIGPSRAR